MSTNNNNVAINLKEEELKMQENKVKAKVNDIIIKCTEELNKQKNQQDSIVFAIDCLNCKNLKTFANENEYMNYIKEFNSYKKSDYIKTIEFNTMEDIDDFCLNVLDKETLDDFNFDEDIIFTDSITDSVENKESDNSNTIVNVNDDITRIINTVSKYTKENKENISITMQQFNNTYLSNVFDIQVKNDNRTIRAYTIIKDIFIPNRLSVMCSIKNSTVIAVPLVKSERKLLKRILNSFYILNNSEVNNIFQKYYLPDLNLYKHIDFSNTDFSNIHDKTKFVDNIANLIITNDNYNSTRFRIEDLKDENNFTLISDNEAKIVPNITLCKISGIKLEIKENVITEIAPLMGASV